MIIKDIFIYPVMLPMKQSFQIAGGQVGNPQSGAPHIYVKIVSEDGIEGWGEARPSHRWSYETMETAVSTLNTYLKPALIGKHADDISSIQTLLDAEIASGMTRGQPICKAAIDLALHDLIGKQWGKKLPELWLGKARTSISLSYLISVKNPEEAAEKAKYASQNGFCALDVKIGFEVGRDMEIVESVKASAPDLFLRVDANQGYQLTEAVKAAKRLEQIGADVFEQPLKANDLLGHRELRRRSSIPIALDESIWSPSDVLQAVRLEAMDYTVIKLTKMGGLHSAKLAGEIAREANLGLLGGGLTESAVGLIGSAHLFNHLGIDIPVDLNGPFFLEDDPVINKGEVEGGSFPLPEGHGIGCEVSQEKLEAYKISV